MSPAPNAFVVSSARPAYLDPGVRASLRGRVERARRELRCCCACPRNCRVDRTAGREGVCRTGRHARVSSAFPHPGEEDCLRGTRGSGTVFFSMCNLHCVFCQNWDISQRPNGRETNAAEIAEIMLALQEAGCHNVNLVTPEHVVPQVVEALALAIDRGLTLPVVYNTSAYDALESLKLLDGLVDIYMPDLKFHSAELARRLCRAEDYPRRARDAIREMHRQVGDLRFTPDGVACRGVLVRHLVLPGLVEDSRRIFHWLADEVSPDTFVNIMGQYHPAYQVGGVAVDCPDPAERAYAEIDRSPTPAELEDARQAARAAGLWRFDERRTGA